MKTMRWLILAGMVLAGLVGKADATIVYSSSSISGAVLVSTPSVSGQLIRIKACNVGNGGSIDTCFNVIDRGASDVTKAVICAAKGNANSFPPSGATNNTVSGTPGAMSPFFGEDFTISGAFVVTSATPSATTIITCSYQLK